MAKQATLNIRLPEDLKKRGTSVLEREGYSVSDAIRLLYEYMDKTQTVPEFLKAKQDPEGEDIHAKRRQLLRNMAGILPKDITLQEAKEARFAAHGL